MRQTKAVEAKPAVTTRLNVTSLEVEVDRTISRLPKKGPLLDLGDPEDRKRLKQWLMDFAEHLAWHLQMDFAKASTLGMEQMAKLIRSPKYREVVAEREARIGDVGQSDIVKKVRKTRRKVEADKRLAAEGEE